MRPVDISVIICTRNRARSLQETLESLLQADRTGITYEVVIVDNGSTDDTHAVIDAFRSHLSIRALIEPYVGEYGKGPAINRAIEAGPLGRIIAVIDDDITADHGWLKGIVAACDRWPDFDFFTGPVRCSQDKAALPRWLHEPRICGWTLSVVDYGPRDRPLRDGGSFSGNHFWFRASVLSGEVRFENIWYSEPVFFNLLLGRGHRGMYSAEASVVHHIQAHLLDSGLAVARAKKTGQSVARMRLQPYRPCIKAARLCRKHRILGRLFCLTQFLRWKIVGLSDVFGTPDAQIKRRILAAQGTAYYSEMLRLCSLIEDYQILPFKKLIR